MESPSHSGRSTWSLSRITSLRPHAGRTSLTRAALRTSSTLTRAFLAGVRRGENHPLEGEKRRIKVVVGPIDGPAAVDGVVAGAKGVRRLRNVNWAALSRGGRSGQCQNQHHCRTGQGSFHGDSFRREASKQVNEQRIV